MALLYRVKMPLEDIRNLKIGIRAKLQLNIKSVRMSFSVLNAITYPLLRHYLLGVSDYQTTLDNNFCDCFIVVWNKPQGSIYLVP